MILAGTILATIVLRRAPGMSMLRIPVFTWTMVATCLNVLFAFPALLGALGLIFVARHTDIAVNPATYLNLFWFYGHPVVYVMFFPFVGAALEVLATNARRRMAGYGPFVLAIIGFAATVDGGVGPPHVHDRPGHQPVLRGHQHRADGVRRRRVPRRLPDHVGRGDRDAHLDTVCARPSSRSSSWAA